MKNIMKNILCVLGVLLWAQSAFSAPTNSLTIAPTASSGTTISSNDENTRNNTVASTYNAHDHNDIDQTANTLAVGDGAAGDKNIQANNADASKPALRYNDTSNIWQLSQDGSTYSQISTLAGVETYTGAKTYSGNVILSQTAPATPVANTLYQDNFAKGWVNFTGSSGEINDDFNVTSITDNGVGDSTIVWATPFTNTSYAVSGIVETEDAGTPRILTVQNATRLTGSVRVSIRSLSNASIDVTAVHIIAYGDQ